MYIATNHVTDVREVTGAVYIMNEAVETVYYTAESS